MATTPPKSVKDVKKQSDKLFQIKETKDTATVKCNI